MGVNVTLKIANAVDSYVYKTKDNQFITHKDVIFLQNHINRFQNGYTSQQKARAATDGPIAHKVIDYIMPKTQARLFRSLYSLYY